MWQNYESHRTPPSDVIKDITISTRDRATGPKIHITFYRPAEFTVSMGKNNQTLLIRVKPVTPQQKNESATAPVEPVAQAKPVAAVPVVVPAIAKATAPVSTGPAVAVVAAKPVATVPVAVSTIAKTPAPVPAQPAVAAVSAKPEAVEAKTVASPPVIVAPSSPVSVTPVSDGVIDDITLHTAATGEVNAEIKFALPLRYLRHFPKGKSEFTAIYFDTLKSASATNGRITNRTLRLLPT